MVVSISRTSFKLSESFQAEAQNTEKHVHSIRRIAQNTEKHAWLKVAPESFQAEAQNTESHVYSIRRIVQNTEKHAYSIRRSQAQSRSRRFPGRGAKSFPGGSEKAQIPIWLVANWENAFL